MFVRRLIITEKMGHSAGRFDRFHRWRTLVVGFSIICVIGLFLSSCIRYNRDEMNERSNRSQESEMSTTKSRGITKTMEAFNNLLSERTSSNYCSIKDCKTVYCSNTPIQSDPGIIVADFIKSEFKFACDAVKSVKLIFDNCKFPSNSIRRNWLRTDLMIDDLIFSSCFLTELEDDAFFVSAFSEMKTLTIINNTIDVLRKAVFSHLSQLKVLTIRDNMLKQVDFDLLSNQAHTLENLELDGVIDSMEILRNITGGKSLRKLQLLSLRRNNLPTIEDDVFSGVSKVQSLFLDASEIRSLSVGAFQSMAKSIFMLIMSDNSITTLPEGLFDPIVQSNSNFRVSIENNPFHCDCSLKWMQDFIQEYPLIVRIIPECKTPKSNEGVLLTRAILCQENYTKPLITSTESSIKPTKEISEVTSSGVTSNNETIQVMCSNFQFIQLRAVRSRELLQKGDFQLQQRYPLFSAMETEADTIFVRLPNLHQQLALIWFKTDDPEESLKCAKNVRHSYTIEDTSPLTSYTICIFRERENTISPLNCLALTTSGDYSSRIWLTNADKSTVFFLSTVSFLISCLAVTCLTCFVIRRNPALLKGAKRVMIVKRRSIDALVLPKGVSISSGNGNTATPNRSESINFQEDGYVTPLPPLTPRRNEVRLHRQDSRVSGTSWQSDGQSYISGVEPSIPQMVSWKLKRLKSQIEQKKMKAPPLPPRHLPSISSGVRSEENIYSDKISYTV